jgi:SAM-dependent methyltransferase
MPATDRLTTERQFHDEQAAERANSFRTGQAQLVFCDETYLDHETWVRPAFNWLGDLRGRVALDYGCGHGMAAVVMARAGATVTAFDLSPGYVLETQRRAIANNVTVSCVTANGEHLPFPSGSFDVVWGNAILHHLDLAHAGRELYRILKPGGRAVFCEPWGGNPFLQFARRHLPYPAKNRTPDEVPLVQTDLVPLLKLFPQLELQGFQFLGMIRRLGVRPSVCRWLDRIDSQLLALVPALSNWCRYVVLRLYRAP